MTEKSTKCSVLMGTYNRPGTVREAIASVVAQRMTDWELILINDGGQDVEHVVAEFDDPRIRYFNRTENRGLAACLNFALSRVRGEYIAYLGDDDLFYPNHLEVLSRTLDENPDIGLAYSDLYGVSCITDEKTGRRYVLDKKIQVCRDFNRNFMFYYNHVLHVSLLHRKEAAFKVGGFDESVRVLIEWSLNRRLCHYYDFLHVNQVTGEYYMPVFKSDRISVVQRKDKTEYRHNLRRIKAGLPPEPWPKVDRVDVLFPITEWNEPVREKIAEAIDHIEYPFRFLLINNEPGRSLDGCYEALGRLSELRNIRIVSTPGPLCELDAYHHGASLSDAEYVFLMSMNTRLKEEDKRVVIDLDLLRQNVTDAVKWDCEEERDTSYDMLVRRDLFLDRSSKEGQGKTLRLRRISKIVPESYKFDVLFAQVKRHLVDEEFQSALEKLDQIATIKTGVPQLQFLMEHRFKALVGLGKYHQAERELKELVEQGFRPDNLFRLGELYKTTSRYTEAVDCYRGALVELGLLDDPLESHLFPMRFPKEMQSFGAILGLAECYEQLGRLDDSARMYRLAFKLRLNSHKPYMGMAKLRMDQNQLDEAGKMLAQFGEGETDKDPEAHYVVGRYCLLRKEFPGACVCFAKALELDPLNKKYLDAHHHVCIKLGWFDESKAKLKAFLEANPDSGLAMSRLAALELDHGDPEAADEMIERGRRLHPDHAVFKGLEKKAARLARASDSTPAAVSWSTH